VRPSTRRAIFARLPASGGTFGLAHIFYFLRARFLLGYRRAFTHFLDGVDIFVLLFVSPVPFLFLLVFLALRPAF
jgi:hypothetical protein